MKNDFFGFSPESFEQFARALSVTVLGPGVRAFGNGPDGGREATFRGEVDYPSPPAVRWNGYGVIQAKCKEKCESTQKDQHWALSLLRKELDLFVSSSKRQPKPEYYIFVTNVELTSAAGGGIDTADGIARSYYGNLPLKGHAIWDANELAAFLAVYQELRTSFREFLTTGDVLSAMLSEIRRREPNATRILSMFLERELRADETSRLDQAGNRTDDQLRLAELFFDIPASSEPEAVAPKEEIDSDGRLPRGVLWEMLRDGSRKLDPMTLYNQEKSSSEQATEEFPARYILLGGPGSGKSTLAQFLAQIHRAALLMRREPHVLGPQTRKIIEETRQLCDREGLPWPATPRYPFRVELNRFGKSLSSDGRDGASSLSEYLLGRVRGQHALRHEVLLEWLGTYPSLLILDGLDEVPATSNRADVLKTVHDFLAEVRQVEGDAFVVATSRHQGYAGEFSGQLVALRHIMPLSCARALRYVEAYAKARFGKSRPEKGAEVVAKLSQSTRRQLTAQLMSTPLQVTFMATVVAARGDPGEDRWQLFESYYRTIYDRERQKAVPPYDTVLSKQQPTIDRLHHDIGFWLQYRGETAEGTSVSLPIGVFEGLVDSYLAEIGREAPDKERLVRLITDAARQRLVFLTSRIAGELSFDVRSLQEYMAAECITTGGPDLVHARLKAIAAAPYWRNVFLFAASKCFADTRSRHLQDAIRVLCEDLNGPGDRVLCATRAGSDVALDILQSGAVAENPNYSRHLARIGLATLQQPYLGGETEKGPAPHQRLALVYREFLEDVYREQLQLWGGQADASRTLGAWPLILGLCRDGIAWAEDLLERQFRRVLPELTRLGDMISDVVHVPYARRHLAEYLQTIPPASAFAILRPLSPHGQAPDLLEALRMLAGRRLAKIEIPLRIRGSRIDGCRFELVSTRQPDEDAKALYAACSQMSAAHLGWLPFTFTRDLLDAPNHETLASILDQCADAGWSPSDNFGWSVLPWPLSVALNYARSVSDLRKTAKRLRTEAARTSEDWGVVEERWASQGITISEICEVSSRPGQLPFLVRGDNVAATSMLYARVREYPGSFIRALCDAARQAPRPEVRFALTWFLLHTGSDNGGLQDYLDPPELQALLEGTQKIGALWLQNLIKRPEDPAAEVEWLQFFDWLGRSDALSQYYRGYHVSTDDRYDDDWCDCFQQAFASGGSSGRMLPKAAGKAKPLRLGLLRLLGRLASTGRRLDLVPRSMLQLTNIRGPRFKLGALLVRISQGDMGAAEARAAAGEAIGLLVPPAEDGADHLLFRTIEAHLVGDGAICELLLGLRERMPAGVPLGAARCERLLRGMLRSRSSDLERPDELRRLQLPIVTEAS